MTSLRLTGELRVPEPHGEAPRAIQLQEAARAQPLCQGGGAHLASFLRAVSRKSLISEICFGCHEQSAEVRRSQGQTGQAGAPFLAHHAEVRRAVLTMARQQKTWVG